MFGRRLAFNRWLVTICAMWRLIPILLIMAILAGPVLSMHNPACDSKLAARLTAVSATSDALSPCQESAEQAKADKRNSHTASSYQFMPPSDHAPGTAVYSLSFLWAHAWVGVETAVNPPPNPPPRSL